MWSRWSKGRSAISSTSRCAAAGRWRGGLGVETEFLIQGEHVTGVAFGDGVEEEARAFGFFGGQPGSRNEITLAFPDGTTRRAKTKEILRGIPRGTRLRQLAGGGGGYGDPRERPAARVLEDVRNGLVSVPRSPANRYLYSNGWIIVALRKLGYYRAAAAGTDIKPSLRRVFPYVRPVADTWPQNRLD